MSAIRTLAARTRRLHLLLVLAAGVALHDAHAAGSDVYAKAAPACVEVLVNGRLSGSGAFISSDGVVLTACHAVGAPGSTVEVRSPLIGRHVATVMAVDQGHDLALLRVGGGRGPYPALSLADKTPAVGASVWLFGAPIFRHEVMLPGKVARAAHTYEYLAALGGYAEVYFIAGPSPVGTSGGPWLNERGEVVGLQSGYMKMKDASVGIVFVAPVEAIRALLAAKRTANTPTLGIAVEEVWEQMPRFLKRVPRGTEGVVVRLLQPDGPAARAGIKQWDTIVAVEGKPVKYRDQLLRSMRARKPGEGMRLTILRPDGAGTDAATPVLGCLEVKWLKPAP